VSPGRRGGNPAKTILASLLLNEYVVSWPVTEKRKSLAYLKPSHIKTSKLKQNI
jgi:hypothetical protein